MLSLGAAATVAGVSVPTPRKHLKAGRLEAERASGTFGDTWKITSDVLAAFVTVQYGRDLDLSNLAQQPQKDLAPQDSVSPESAVELRQRLDDTLLELGKYKAPVEASEAADKRVEAITGALIAELQRRRDTAQMKAKEAAAELARRRSRGFRARLFGGKA